MAPAVLAEDSPDYFDLDRDSPYMLIVADVLERRRRVPQSDEAEVTGLDLLNQIRSDVPAITHVDHSARVQTVRPDSNPEFYRLLQAFKELTDTPSWSIQASTSATSLSCAVPMTPTGVLWDRDGPVVLGNIVLRKRISNRLCLR